MTEEPNPPPHYDAVWKEIIERFLPEFLRYFVPALAELIDWSPEAPIHFLDKELQTILPKGSSGPGRVDKLVQVHLRDGKDAHLLIHIEIQGDYDPKLQQRIFRYVYRIYEQRESFPATLLILADDRPTWRPCSFELSSWESGLRIHWSCVKLLDLAQRWEELEAAPGPIPTLIMAYLRAKETRNGPRSRLQWKIQLLEGLAKPGLSPDDQADLFRFLDWLMILPDDLDQEFLERVAQLNEDETMPHISSLERIIGEKAFQQGLEKGREQGIEQGQVRSDRRSILDVLRTRFGEIPQSLCDAIEAIDDRSVLAEKLRLAVTVSSLDEF